MHAAVSDRHIVGYAILYAVAYACGTVGVTLIFGQLQLRLLIQILRIEWSNDQDRSSVWDLGIATIKILVMILPSFDAQTPTSHHACSLKIAQRTCNSHVNALFLCPRQTLKRNSSTSAENFSTPQVASWKRNMRTVNSDGHLFFKYHALI